MILTPTKDLPENFNLFLKHIIQEYSHYFGKYLDEYLPLLNPETYLQLLKKNNIECLLGSFPEKNPSALIISSCNTTNTRREIILLQYLKGNNPEEFYRLMEGLVRFWKSHHIQEIIFDIPTIPNLHLPEILCPLSFQIVPRLIMVKEQDKDHLTKIKDKNIHPLSSNNFSSIISCLQSAYEHIPWKYLHPEIYDSYDAYEFLQNLIYIQNNTSFPTGFQYKQKEQSVGIILGNLTGNKSATLFHLAVHPSYRRQGIATILLQKWCQVLFHRGIKNIFLWTQFGNPALKLYLKQNFHPLYTYPACYYSPQKVLS